MGSNITIYTQKVADEICALLKQGHTLRAACRLHPDAPAESTIREWVHDDRDGFTAQYLRAREIGYLAMADQLVEIADDGSNDTYETEDGTKTNWDVLGRSKLRSDVRQWLLSKALPKIYGNKTTTELTGADGAPLFKDEDDRARRVAALKERVQNRIAQNNSAEPTDASDLA